MVTVSYTHLPTLSQALAAPAPQYATVPPPHHKVDGSYRPDRRPQSRNGDVYKRQAARSANAFDQDQLIAGRGLFLFQHPVLPRCV